MKRLKSIALTIPALLVCLQAHAQQPTPAFRFQALVATGANIGGITLGPEVQLKNFAVNARGDVAMAVDGWTIPNSRERGPAVLMPHRIVAQKWDTADGKILVNILADTLAIDEQGTVAFEAIYRDYPTEVNVHTGVFHERHLEFEISGRGSAADVTLTADGRIEPHGRVFQPPTPTQSAAPAPAKAASNDCGPGIKIKKGSRIDKWIKGLPVEIPTDALSQPCPASTQTKQPAPQKAAPARTAQVRLSVADESRWIEPCRSPAFPKPDSWAQPARLRGPMNFTSTDAPQTYRSPIFGQMDHAVRVVYFSDCSSPQVAVITDTEHPSHFEVWSAAGLVTYSDSGVIKTPGYENFAVSGPVTGPVPALIVTRSGQVAFPVSLEAFQGETGFAILLATHQ